jgi:primosomal protein N'
MLRRGDASRLRRLVRRVAKVEWAVLIEGRESNVPRRARRQRELLEALGALAAPFRSHGCCTKTGASRDALKRLTERGAVRLERRPEPAPVSYTRGSGSKLVPYRNGASQALARGGAHLWRVPTPECPAAVASVAREAAGLGKGTLVLAPEVEAVERLVWELRRLLPPADGCALPWRARPCPRRGVRGRTAGRGGRPRGDSSRSARAGVAARGRLRGG